MHKTVSQWQVSLITGYIRLQEPESLSGIAVSGRRTLWPARWSERTRGEGPRTKAASQQCPPGPGHLMASALVSLDGCSSLTSAWIVKPFLVAKTSWESGSCTSLYSRERRREERVRKSCQVVSQEHPAPVRCGHMCPSTRVHAHMHIHHTGLLEAQHSAPCRMSHIAKRRHGEPGKPGYRAWMSDRNKSRIKMENSYKKDVQSCSFQKCEH